MYLYVNFKKYLPIVQKNVVVRCRNNLHKFNASFSVVIL